MERAYDRWLGTALVAVGLAILLFGFYQAYSYTQSPPTGQYNFVTFSGAVNGSLNGRFVEVFTFLAIEYFVGAAILRAGWNLITPKSETIQVRVKPRSLQVEPVSTELPTAPAPAAVPAKPSPSGAGSGLPFPDPARTPVSATPWAEESTPPST